MQRFFKYIVCLPRIWSVNDFSVILLHVGSNNLSEWEPKEYGGSMEHLVQQILCLNPSAKIILTSIMPRPVDTEETRPKAIAFNNELIRLSDPRAGPRYVKNTIQPGVNVFYANLAKVVVTSEGTVIRKMFTKVDGLHLSERGNQVVEFYLRSVFNNSHFGHC